MGAGGLRDNEEPPSTKQCYSVVSVPRVRYFWEQLNTAGHKDLATKLPFLFLFMLGEVVAVDFSSHKPSLSRIQPPTLRLIRESIKAQQAMFGNSFSA